MPRSYTVALLLFLLGAVLVAGLEGLYFSMPRLSPPASGGRMAAFDLDAAGSVAAWFSSTTLALCGAAAIVVYTIRRHRFDDYHGRYRIWLWTAGCAWILSVDEAASLHEAFTAWMVHASGRELLAGGAAWWIGLYGLIVGAVGLRLVMELRECRVSTAALALAGVCYVVAIAMRLDWLCAGRRDLSCDGQRRLRDDRQPLAAAGDRAVRPTCNPRRPGAAADTGRKGARAAGKRRMLWNRTAMVDAAHTTPKPPTKRSDLMPVERSSVGLVSRAAAELARDEQDDERLADERRPLSRKLAARYRDDDGDDDQTSTAASSARPSGKPCAATKSASVTGMSD